MEHASSLTGLIHANGRMHAWIDKICTNKHVYILTHGQTSGKNRLTERKANIRPECTCTQMDGQIDASCHSAKGSYRHRFVGSNKTFFWVPWRAFQKLTNLTDAKTKHLMEVNSEPPPPRCPGLPLYVPTCAPSSAACLAGYSENIEWKVFSIQPVSHLGKEGFGWREQPDFRLWSPAVMTEPRAENSGESLPEARSSNTRYHGKNFQISNFQTCNRI